MMSCRIKRRSKALAGVRKSPPGIFFITQPVLSQSATAKAYKEIRN